jgi:RNA polymerase sigma factor (sigma-70 family)
MESAPALPDPPGALGHHLSLIVVREHGVSAGQLPRIGVDPDLFDAFYNEHLEDLQRFVARRVGDPERAADLTADIFLAAVDSAHRYLPRGTPKSWLYGIARIVVAEDRRRGARERARGERLRGSALLDEEEAARIEARIDAAAQSRRLYEAMDSLGDDERAVLELVAIDELTVAEAAAAAGIRPVTARVRLHRARRKLRAELELATTPPKASKEE